MEPARRTRATLLVVLALVAALAGRQAWEIYAPRHTPAGQPPLLVVHEAGLEALTMAFDSSAKVKILALLSPT